MLLFSGLCHRRSQLYYRTAFSRDSAGIASALHSAHENGDLGSILPLLIMLIGFFINVSAPGNAVRIAAQLDSMGPVEAVYYSFVYAVKGIGEWTNLYVIFFAVLSGSLFVSGLFPAAVFLFRFPESSLAFPSVWWRPPIRRPCISWDTHTSLAAP